MKRLVVIVGGLGGTALILWAVLMLGSWGYDTRRMSIHNARLTRLVEKKPRIELVTAGLEQEGSPLVASPRGEAELRRAAAEWGDGRAAEVLAKSPRFAATRVFQAGDAIYFLYFDEGGVLRDFTCVSR